ncbi:hypothetical protein [Oribacterium sp. FC2011]|uniref:hypothetical protein n=1 Tax=Oribacterium sp. FC2011 TaxID=1408311 RepID=UPI0004E2142E|nr:hypothetical protein [Oribacterium sp. FC2011]
MSVNNKINNKILNELGRQWGKRDIKNETMCRELQNKIFVAIYNCYSNNKYLDALSTFFERYWEKYDPSKKQLGDYVDKYLEYSSKYDYKKDWDGHRILDDTDGYTAEGVQKKVYKFAASNLLSAPVKDKFGEDQNEEELDFVRDKVDQYGDYIRKDGIDNTLLHAVTIMLSLEDYLSGKSKNEKSMMYKRMFHTEAVSILCHEGVIDEEYQHERELIDSLKHEFLDYYTLDKCREIAAILRSPLKKLCDISDEDPEDVSEAKLPLKQGVIKTYLKKYEGMDVSDGAISQQRAKFYEFYKENIEYERYEEMFSFNDCKTKLN